MTTLLTLGTMALGLLIRLAVPIAVTLIVIVLLRLIDAHWQAESQFVSRPAVAKPLCWQINACPPAKRDACPAYHSDRPCWQVYRGPDGRLAAACLSCAVFRSAPVPAGIRA